MVSRAKFVFALIGLLCLMMPGALRADTTYTYTGANFYYNGANCSPKCVTNVSGYFTVSTELASNTTYNLEPDTVAGGTILDYSFTDGRNTWNKANFVATDAYSSTSEFSITTGNGNIVAWNFNIDDYSGAQFGYYCSSCTAGVITTQWNGSNSGSDGTNVYNNYDAYSIYPDKWNALGTWSGAVATPEPSSFLLFGSGIVGLVGTLRKKYFS